MIALSASTAAVVPASAQDLGNRTIGRDNPQSYSRLSPIYNGFDHQPTESELRASHEQDVTGKQAREVDQLYDELMSSGDQTHKRRRARPH
jgi:hypothetical protein